VNTMQTHLLDETTGRLVQQRNRGNCVGNHLPKSTWDGSGDTSGPCRLRTERQSSFRMAWCLLVGSEQEHASTDLPKRKDPESCSPFCLLGSCKIMNDGFHPFLIICSFTVTKGIASGMARPSSHSSGNRFQVFM
jgi:hypothetical protein